MQIDWSQAPEWARYCAMDEDGEIWVFEEMPVYNEFIGWWHADGLCDVFGMYNDIAPHWTQTLQERPQ